ncbi:MAG TPA: carbonic anhydrase [Candidatus Methylomirabilis sp.]|nr:carbonic anhydrase [Candidatus Methylomirabilis sp.]
MQLDEVLKRNQEFVRGRAARPLPPVEAIPLAVVACYDPRLDALIWKSLGLSPGEAFLFRTAGAFVQSEGTVAKSLGLAVFLFGVRDIVVIGHSSCRMAAFDTASFIDAFRKRGVAREAFGTEDLRTWAGAIPDPRRGVMLSVANIQAAQFLPKDLSVAGLVLDDSTGAFEVVVKPGETPEAEPGAVVAAPAPTPLLSSVPTPGSGATGPGTFRLARDPLHDAVRTFVDTIQGSERWRGEIRNLKQELAAQKDPMVKLDLLEKFARRAGVQSTEAREAFARVKREASSAGRLRDPQELFRLFHELTGGS